MSEGRAAVILQWAEAGIGHANLIAMIWPQAS